MRQKVLKNMKIGQANTKREFLKKYPDADVSKFRLEVELTDEGDIDRYETYFKLTEKDLFNITSDTFLNNKKWTKYLTSNKDRGFRIWYPNGTIQPYEKNTTKKDIDKFKVYVIKSLSRLKQQDSQRSDKNYFNNPWKVTCMLC